MYQQVLAGKHAHLKQEAEQDMAAQGVAQSWQRLQRRADALYNLQSSAFSSTRRRRKLGRAIVQLMRHVQFAPESH